MENILIITNTNINNNYMERNIKIRKNWQEKVMKNLYLGRQDNLLRSVKRIEKNWES